MNFKSLKDFMDRLTDGLVPGNSVSVYLKNEEVFRYSSGFADKENKIPMSGDHLINIYSCSKIATVTAAMKLIEDGFILLSDPLYNYIPEFREMTVKTQSGEIKKAENPITIGNLFTHTAGFNYNFNADAFKKAREKTNGKMNTLEVIRCLAEEPLSYEPGTKWQYSLAHDVLAAVVEIVSGKRFCEYVSENIFLPCGMKNFSYHATPEIEKKMAQQYILETKGEFDAVKAQMGMSEIGGAVKNTGLGNSHRLGLCYDSGGSGIITSVNDYALFINALANYGKAKTDEQILSKGSVELLRTNQLTDELLKYFTWPQLKGYGYGLGVRTLISKAKGGSIGGLGEFGWGGAAGATAIVDPEIGLGVFYAHHMLNPMEDYYQPRLKNVVYKCVNE